MNIYIKKHHNIYEVKINNKYKAILNLYSDRGIILLDPKSQLIYKILGNKKKLTDLYKNIKLKRYSITNKEITSLIKKLIYYDIYYYLSKKINEAAYPIIHEKHEKSLGVWIYLTNQCNFSCRYCFVEKKNKNLSIKNIKVMVTNIMNSAKKNRLKSIDFVLAGGEPLLKLKEIKKMAAEIKKIGKKILIPYKIAIITNGSLLTENIAKYFKKNKIRVSISLDGVANYHNNTRVFPDGRGTYKFVHKGIKIAKKFKILDNVNVVITSKNIEHLPDLAKFLLKNQILFAFSLYKRTEVYSKTSLSPEKLIPPTEKLIKYFKRTINIIYNYYKNNNYVYSPLKANILLEGLSHKLAATPGHFCSAGYGYCSVNTDGLITMCPDINYVVSNIESNQIVDDVLNNSKFILSKYSFQKVKPCFNCQWKYICKNFCLADRIKYNSSLNKPSYYCQFYKNFLPYLIKKEAKFLLRLIIVKNKLYEIYKKGSPS